MLNKLKGFTLAEVLIALAIIGVVAAITIPMLYQRTNKRELVSAFLKTSSDLSQAFKYAEVNDGLTKLDEEDFKRVFKSYLNTVACEEHDVCLTSGVTFDWEGSFDQTCSTVSNGTNRALELGCIALIADINSNKHPNKAGRDKFRFWLTKHGAFPDGYDDRCSGLDCGAYVLSHHQLYNLDLLDN